MATSMRSMHVVWLHVSNPCDSTHIFCLLSGESGSLVVDPFPRFHWFLKSSIWTSAEKIL